MTGLAVPIPYNWQPGDTGNAALLDAQIRDPMTFLLNPPIAQLYASATQSLTTSVAATAALDSVITDPYGGFNATTHLWTAPVDGWWDIRGKWHCGANATGTRSGWITVNGSLAPNTQGWGQPGVAAVTTYADGLVNVLTGQTVGLACFQTSGGPLSTATASGTFAALTIQFKHA